MFTGRVAKGQPLDGVIRGVETFVVASQAARLRALTASKSPSARSKFNEALGYNVTFRRDRTTPFRNADVARDEVVRLARRGRLADSCDVASEFDEVDGKQMPIAEVFSAIEAWGLRIGWTFAVVDADHLAFFVGGERADGALVLWRP